MNDRDYRAVSKALERCEKIENAVRRFGADFETFRDDDCFQDACCMNAIQLGEMVARLSDDLKSRYPEIPWSQIRAVRNLYAHDYDSVDLRVVWQTVVRDVPALKIELRRILNEG